MNSNNPKDNIDRREFIKVSAAKVAMLFIDHVGRFVLTPLL